MFLSLSKHLFSFWQCVYLCGFFFPFVFFSCCHFKSKKKYLFLKSVLKETKSRVLSGVFRRKRKICSQWTSNVCVLFSKKVTVDSYAFFFFYFLGGETLVVERGICSYEVIRLRKMRFNGPISKFSIPQDAAL